MQYDYFYHKDKRIEIYESQTEDISFVKSCGDHVGQHFLVIFE